MPIYSMVAGDCSPTQRVLGVAPVAAPPLSILGMLQTPAVGGVSMGSALVVPPVIDVDGPVLNRCRAARAEGRGWSWG